MARTSIRLRRAPQEAAKRTAQSAGVTLPAYFGAIIREYAAKKPKRAERPPRWDSKLYRETRVELDPAVLDAALVRAASEGVTLSTVVHRAVVQDAKEQRGEEYL